LLGYGAKNADLWGRYAGLIDTMCSHARKYLSTLPTHSSQTQIASDEESTTYSLRVRPNYEFLQALLQQGDQIEVISPQGVKEEMIRFAEDVLTYYKECGPNEIP